MQVIAWGEANLYLKVREDNEPAMRMYEASGYELRSTREPPSLPGWQDRWKHTYTRTHTIGTLTLSHSRWERPDALSR